MEKLPIDLQYLQPDKEREPDADIRRMLIEALNKVSNLSTIFTLATVFCTLGHFIFR